MVVRNSAMRTARNVFIVNLAVSDLMLCLITMPLTLVEILYMTWQVWRKNKISNSCKYQIPYKDIKIFERLFAHLLCFFDSKSKFRCSESSLAFSNKNFAIRFVHASRGLRTQVFAVSDI